MIRIMEDMQFIFVVVVKTICKHQILQTTKINTKQSSLWTILLLVMEKNSILGTD